MPVRGSIQTVKPSLGSSVLAMEPPCVFERGVVTVGAAVDVNEHHFRLSRQPADDQASIGAIVFFLQIDTVTQKNSSRDKHLQNRLSRTPCAFGAD